MNNELVKLLQTLVAMPSVNPALTDDAAIGGELRFAKILGDELRYRGFRVETLEVNQDRPNVIARFGPDNPKRRIMIEAHMDTQGVHGMTVPPFAAEIRGSRLYGRGACDTKGPMAAALFALDPETLAKLSGAGIEIIFAGVIGEERGNLGAEQLVDAEISADEALVMEPTELQIVHAHKGTLWFELEIRGRAAHGSQPEKGVSAIHGAMRAIEMLMQQTAADQKKTNPLLGPPTVNIGVIRGGTSINIVPERCVMEIDRRTLPEENTGDILARIRTALTELQSAGHFTGFDIRMSKDCCAFETAATSPMIARLKSAIADSCVAPVACGAGWYSDAGALSRIIKDVVVFGPGSIAQAHTADEFIELDSLEKGAAIIRNYLHRTAAAVSSGGD